MAQKKEDIVCAFHGDIEHWMEKIDGKIDTLDKKITSLKLWKAGVVGYASGAAAVTVLFLKFVIKI